MTADFRAHLAAARAESTDPEVRVLIDAVLREDPEALAAAVTTSCGFGQMPSAASLTEAASRHGATNQAMAMMLHKLLQTSGLPTTLPLPILTTSQL